MTKEEMLKKYPEPRSYWIKKPHYIQQDGELYPSLVGATPDNPVLVTLPAGMGPSSMMTPEKKVDGKASQPPKKGVMKVASARTKDQNKRAADQ